MPEKRTTSKPAEQSISGVEAMRGIGTAEARSFWADAWERVLRNRGALVAIGWIALVGLGAVIAPVIANSNPLWMESIATDGTVSGASSPLWQSLSATDILLLVGTILGLLLMSLPMKLPRGERLGILALLSVLWMLTVVLASFAADFLDEPTREGWLREVGSWVSDPRNVMRRVIVVGVIGLPLFAAAAWIPLAMRPGSRCALLLAALAVVAAVCGSRWQQRPSDYDRFVTDEAQGKVHCTYTLIPWSPDRLRSELITVAPMNSVAVAVGAKDDAAIKQSRRFSDLAVQARRDGNDELALRYQEELGQVNRQRDSLQREWKPLLGSPFAQHRFLLGTDSNGADVLAQLLWACRLSISVGFVSTGIAVLIGVTMGSIMGYFGGKIDLILFRIVEIFMAVPVLFLLIVAAGVLPRNTYVMMAIIGCLSWTGAARFTRAEFMKLRNQDFVQGARASGLPLRSVLFRHMLPNGVTPVLVDASFAIAGAIIAEATLSYLGLGPDNQASWGKLLSSATGTTGTFIWWLAIFPGAAIFCSVLAYNVLGGALRDAIDPKLRKAAH